MQTFFESLSSFEHKDGYISYSFGDHDEYELRIEPLLFDGQFYLALYKEGSLLIDKIPIKPGKE